MNGGSSLPSSPCPLRAPIPLPARCRPRCRLQVRHELEQGHSVRYLLPEPVARYIYQHGLYSTGGQQRPRLLHPYGEQKVADSERD